MKFERIYIKINSKLTIKIKKIKAYNANYIIEIQKSY